MSQVKYLLDNLLADIYGRQQRQQSQIVRYRCTFPGRRKNLRRPNMSSHWLLSQRTAEEWQQMSAGRLIDICAILKVEMQLLGYCLGRVLIERDRLKRHQEILCEFVDAILYVEYLCILHGYYDTQPKMRFSLSPPPPKGAAAINVTATSPARSTTAISIVPFASSIIGMQSNSRSSISSAFVAPRAAAKSAENLASLTTASATAAIKTTTTTTTTTTEDAEAASDYIQWLHAMKLVARLPGGMPPEFRRKLWLSLADKYLKSRKVDWAKEEEKCFCEEWREDDEELGIQIVKDLHRTGSNLCTGPAGSINQAKLKRILLGYARYNPEVGYCQGFNMLGALILQVMDKEEIESMKVMIYLVEGVLPTGYFCGSMGGLQADMGVFRELMQTKLPRLAKHLQKLQGPIENAYEPPLTNVFTMQWFLTLFCTCLPMSCVLRVWDLILIEGSDVLLRTALVLWSLLEERVLNARTADEFYGKMGSFSSELLNGHLIDSNGLIEKVVELGPIPDIQKLRDKHLYNIAPLRHKQGLQLYFDDEDTAMDEESRLAVATVWGIPWGRRGSQPVGTKSSSENKDRIALDISLLKKQYDRLRERQKQAHIILSTACSTTARQASTTVAPSMPINQLLLGRTAIVSSKQRRPAPLGSIPPARKPSLPTLLHAHKPLVQPVLRRGETLLWRDTEDLAGRKRRDSLTWKEIKADRANMLREGNMPSGQAAKVRTRMGKSDSSSYSEDSDDDDDDNDDGGGEKGIGSSSGDTSLCDDDDDEPKSKSPKPKSPKPEKSPKRRNKTSRKQKEMALKLQQLNEARDQQQHDRRRPRSWAPSSNEIPFTLMTSDTSPVHSDGARITPLQDFDHILREQEEDSAPESDRLRCISMKNLPGDLDWRDTKYSPIAGDLATLGGGSRLAPLLIQTDLLDMAHITSTSQLSPMPDIVSYLNSSAISPLPTPKPQFLDSTNSLGSDDTRKYDVSDEGVTNEYFERVNSVERPNKLELSYSLNEEDGINDIVFQGPDDLENNDVPEVIKSAPPSDQAAIKLLSNDDHHDFDVDVTEKIEIKSQSPLIEVDTISPNADLYEDSSRRSRRLELLMNYSEKSSAAYIAEATTELSNNFKREKTKDDISDAKEEQLATTVNTVNTVNSATLPPHRIEPEDTTVLMQRDTNVPGRNCDDHFNEVEYRRSRPTIISKEQAALNASRKRRDPRRLTLTRSSTIEIEERYQALEKRLSADALEMAAKYSAIDEQSRKVRDGHDAFKRIPSTADLEERFHCLEKQLSFEKSSSKYSDAHRLTHRESFDSGVPISDMSDSENVPLKNPKRENVVSVSQMEQQISMTSMSSSTNPKEMKKMTEHSDDRKQETDKKQHKSPSDHGEAGTNEKAKIAEKTVSPNRNTDENSKKGKDKPRLTKLPSTAELEDRFDALERQKSTTQKESPGPSQKKEPPDDIKRDKTPDRSKTTNENIKQNDTAKKESPAKENEKIKKDASPVARQKMPPSTEELEKRFQALEKRLSSALLDGPEKNETSTTNNDVSNSLKNEVVESSNKSKKTIETSKETSSRLIQENEIQNRSTSKSPQRNGRSSSPRKDVDADHHDLNPDASNEKTIGKRRASEPPSTEDLEKRYETLKRRMSSNTKTITERGLSHSETVEEAMQRIEKEISEEIETPKAESEEKQCDIRKASGNDMEENVSKQNDGKPKSTTISDSPPQVPIAPPLPPDVVVEPQNGDSRRAVIEEFESKLKSQMPSSDHENLKPSDINPNRRSPTPTRRTDDNNVKIDATSEAHAAEALSNIKSRERYEHWRLQSVQPVRRFSDLLSRSDLENRLQFLEKQLHKKFNKLRRASDSEASSTTTGRAATTKMTTKQLSPTTGRNGRSTSEEELEKRVQMLEKQLSENSLKLLEAMQKRDHDQQHPTISGRDPETPISRRISTETIDATGKELVRYQTNTGELVEAGDLESHKPINISINIKMRLNSEIDGRKTNTMTNLPTTEELSKRLEMLEEQLRLLQGDRPTPEKMEENNLEVPPSVVTPFNSDEDEQLKAESFNIIDPNHSEEQCEKIEAQEEGTPCDIEIVAEELTGDSKNVEQTTDLETSNEEENAIEEHNVKETEETELLAQEKMIINAADVGPMDPNNKTLVLLLDNEPKAVKVRRLTRANTEELEGLFQALEKQLNDRNLIKSEDGRLRRANTEPELTTAADGEPSDESKAISDLTKEIEQFTSDSKHNGKECAKENTIEKKKPTSEKKEDVEVEVEEQYDWGPDFAKWHLKRKTVYLPSTKELEARFRSLERQIKLLEDVEKIDVEQRLNEIEKKIKLQYSLSHEKDLNKFLQLCEGKGLDDDPLPIGETKKLETESPRRIPSGNAAKSTTPTAMKKVTIPCSSPTRSRDSHSGGRRSPYTSPGRHDSIRDRSISPHGRHTIDRRSPPRSHTKRDCNHEDSYASDKSSCHTSPSHSSRRSPYKSPVRHHDDGVESRYRSTDFKSKSKENLTDTKTTKKKTPDKQPPIHPLEMLLDDSPVKEDIPTTGELEYRIRMLDRSRRRTPSPPAPCIIAIRKSRSHSPTIEEIKRRKMLMQSPSPTRREPPTADELDARMRALEEEQSFNSNTQKTFETFNRKLKSILSPTMSFEEIMAAKTTIEEPLSPYKCVIAAIPKSALSNIGGAIPKRDRTSASADFEPRSVSPKTIQFKETEEYRPRSRTEILGGQYADNADGVLHTMEENSKKLQRILQSTISDSQSSFKSGSSTEGLDSLGGRLIRETSPIRRKGTHTGVPLRTDDNINERLTSIKNTIKSIDTLCEEKPYHKEKCQRYIDSLFSESTHFKKKASLEDLRGRECTPAIRISDHSLVNKTNGDYQTQNSLLSRSMGSAESLRSTSPRRGTSPIRYRSNRDLQRDL